MDAAALSLLRRLHHAEATDELIYRALARCTRSEKNRRVLERMAADEARHCAAWGAYLDEEARASKFKVFWYVLLGRIFGLVFVVNLLETGEHDAAEVYRVLGRDIPMAREMMEDEIRHEDSLISLLHEEKLSYISSMVLGLNDALVELTGALAGFTLALNDNTMIGMAGFITGVAATLSMAASEYLARKADPGEEHPLKAASYTGMAYLVTVALLLTPYALCSDPLKALAFCLINATLVIVGFTYFVSVVRRSSFWKGFREMMAISFSVALISFLIGWAARAWLNLDV